MVLQQDPIMEMNMTMAPMMDTEHPPKGDMVLLLMTDMELLLKHLPQNMVHPQILHMARKFLQTNVIFKRAKIYPFSRFYRPAEYGAPADSSYGA